MLEKKIFAKNLQRLMDEKGVDRNELCKALDLSYSTVATWLGDTNGKYPRPQTVTKLAAYFGVPTSALTDEYWLREVSFSEEREVPCFASIMGGFPTNYIDAADVETVKCPSEFKGAKFAARVEGWSMMDGGILDGDIVFFNDCPAFDDGDIIAANFCEGGDASGVIKQAFHTPDGGIRLHSFNDDYADMLFSPRQLAAKEFLVAGVFVGILKSASGIIRMMGRRRPK